MNNPYEPTYEDIIDSLPSEDQQDNLDEDRVDCDVVVQQVGVDAVARALATLQTLLEQWHQNIVFSHVQSIRSLQDDVSMWRMKESRRTTIDFFFEWA